VLLGELAESALAIRPDALDPDPDQAALVPLHGAPIVIPVFVLPGGGPVIGDQALHGLGQRHDVCGALDLEVIRGEAGMPTSRFCSMLGIPQRTWRRWQGKAQIGHPPKGPWPTPARDRHRDAVMALAAQPPAWGHRKIWAMARHGGHPVTPSSVLRILGEAGLLLTVGYQRERRQLAAARRAAFTTPPTGRNQVWLLDFSEYETPAGGTWRVAGVADYWSKVEFGWHWSPTANQHDAIAAVEIALAEAQRLLGGTPLVEHLADPIPARSCRSPSLPTKAARSGRSGSARSSPAAPSCATSAPA
jgi:hypothetical protein